MKAKWVLPVLTGLVLVVIVLMIVGQGSRVVNEIRVPEGWVFTFPEGDAKAGQATFMKMQCYSCHEINIANQDLPADMGGIGPNLTPDYALLPKEYLAESIIKAHSEIASPNYKLKQDVAGMGGYNDFLTVKELTDLVAFLKQKPEGNAKN